MRNLLYTILLGLSVHLTGCGDYLDVVPKNDIQTIETIFEKREDAYHWLRSFFIILTPDIADFLNIAGFLGADEIVAGEYCRHNICILVLFFG